MKPTFITVHCSASKKGRYLTASEIRKEHLARGWKDIGYHFVIRTDGAVETGRRIDTQGAHVEGHNKDNVGICLIGGLNAQGKASFTYTPAQMYSLERLLDELCGLYSIPFDNIKGHRDWYGDSNGDGVIDSRDWYKECPCFDVTTWLSSTELFKQGAK